MALNALKSYGYLVDTGPSNPEAVHTSSGRASPSKPARRSAVPLQREFSLPREGVKRALGDDVDDEEHDPKKLRIQGEELVDGDHNARWHHNRPIDNKRGSKRNNEEVEDVDEEETVDMKKRDKRARKVSVDNTAQESSQSEESDANMDTDVDMDSQPLTAAVARLRGKKRDRDEAGSTVGDDEEIDQEGDNKTKRQLKRSKRKSTGQSKSGQSTPVKGKKSAMGKNKQSRSPSSPDSDVTMDSGARTPPRVEGDEWTSHGITYRIGPKGVRQRWTLVKQEVAKFTMPEDSVHNDREDRMPVCVYNWLTDAEYAEAKKNFMLANQIAPTSASKLDRRSSNGKPLLWQDPNGTTHTTPSRRHSSDNLLTSAGKDEEGKPDTPSRSLTIKRIGSAVTNKQARSDAPLMRPLSWYEKQEMEAEARRRRQELERQEEEKNKPKVPSIT
ncbi:hypothetical protein HDZ31DRAFT_77575, partial [Schizophyllum fasciatum]